MPKKFVKRYVTADYLMVDDRIKIGGQMIRITHLRGSGLQIFVAGFTIDTVLPQAIELQVPSHFFFRIYNQK